MKSLYWKNLFTQNIISHPFSHFQWAIIQSEDSTVFFDLRKYSNGRATKEGVCLPIGELKWLKKVLKMRKFGNLKRTYRTLKIENIGNYETKITIEKSTGNKSITLNSIELDNLVDCLDHALDTMEKFCTDFEQPFDFIYTNDIIEEIL